MLDLGAEEKLKLKDNTAFTQCLNNFTLPVIKS